MATDEELSLAELSKRIREIDKLLLNIDLDAKLKKMRQQKFDMN